jgi:hypothetical protein
MPPIAAKESNPLDFIEALLDDLESSSKQARTNPSLRTGGPVHQETSSLTRIMPGEPRRLVLMKKSRSLLLMWLGLLQRFATTYSDWRQYDGSDEQMVFPHVCDGSCRMAVLDRNLDFHVCLVSGNHHRCGTTWCDRGVYSFHNGGYICEITSRLVYNDMQGEMPFGYSAYGHSVETNGGGESALSKDDMKPQTKRTVTQRLIDRDVEDAIRELESKNTGKKLTLQEKREVKKKVTPYSRRQFKQESSKLECEASNLIQMLMPDVKSATALHQQIVTVCVRTWLIVVQSDFYLKGDQNYQFFYHVISVCQEMITGFRLPGGVVVIPQITEVASQFPPVNTLSEFFKKRKIGRIAYKANQQTQTVKLMKVCLSKEHSRHPINCN